MTQIENNVERGNVSSSQDKTKLKKQFLRQISAKQNLNNSWIGSICTIIKARKSIRHGFIPFVGYMNYM